MTRVTLVRARSRRLVDKRKTRRGNQESLVAIPIGILYLARRLRQEGLVVRVVDGYQPEHWLKSPEALAREALEDGAEVVGISAMTSQSRDAMDIGDAVKRQSSARVVFGGVHFSALPEDGLRHGDAVVVGEAEESLAETLRGGGPAALAGVIAGRALSEAEMDRIPFPRAEDLAETAFTSRAPEYSMLTARGCPFNCVFCKDGYRTSKVRHHSVEYVVEHFDYVWRTFGMRRVFVMDDVFVNSTERMEQMIAQFERRGLRPEIRCFVHANTAKPENLRLMRRLGVNSVSLGIESGNDRILQLIGKGTTTERQRRAVELCRGAGLTVTGLYMIGNIGETPETVQDTLRFARSVPTNREWYSFAIPFPGTPFAEVADRYGCVLQPDTSQWSNQELVFIPNDLSEAQMRNLMARARRHAQVKHWKAIVVDEWLPLIQQRQWSDLANDLRTKVWGFLASLSRD